MSRGLLTRRRGVLIIALIVFTLLTSAYLCSGTLEDQKIRRLIRQDLSKRFSASVELGAIHRSSEGDVIADVHLIRQDSYRLIIPKLEVRPSLFALLGQEPVSLHLSSPDMEFKKDLQSVFREGAASVFSTPDSPDRISVEGGTVRFYIDKKRFTLDNLNAEGGLASSFSSKLYPLYKKANGSPLLLHVAHAELNTENLRFRTKGDILYHEKQIRLTIPALSVDNLEFSTTDGQFGLSRGRITLRGELMHDDRENKIKFILNTRFGANDVLYGPLFAKVQELPVALFAKGELDHTQGLIKAEQVSLQLSQVAAAHFKGYILEDSWHLRGNFALPHLDRLQDKTDQILSGSFPGLPEVSEAGGSLQARFRTRGNDRSWTLTGTMEAEKVHLASSQPQISLSSLSSRLPFALILPRQESQLSLPLSAKDDQTRKGHLSLSGLSLATFPARDTEIGLRSTTNRLYVLSPLIFEVSGGSIQVDQLTTGLDKSQLNTRGRIVLKDIDLGQLSKNLPMTRVHGKLRGDLGEISYTDGVFHSTGKLQLNIFGGTVLVRNLRLEQPFSPYRKLHADVTILDIDLSRLSRTLSLGAMNGILEGQISDLTLFGAVPSRFEAQLSTKKRGKRRISAKALDNLSIITRGTGLKGSYRPSDSYRYNKIGVSCSLKNDIFQIKGTARKGSAKYMLDGGNIPSHMVLRINDNSISFQEMLRRIEQIQGVGAKK